MNATTLRTFLRRLQRAAAREQAGELTDNELLARFVGRRDEAAFEVLVWRHGPMVLGVCRRLLRRSQDVEDAFQATFLTLVRKAGAIRRGAAVAGWLYRVAHRAALRARARAARDAPAGPPADEPTAAGPEDEVLRRDLRAVLDEEVNRLPARYRLPVVLCYLGGQTTEEAARQLGCPRGTVLSRLAWARERLRARLTRRGLALPGLALGGVLAGPSPAPAALVQRAVRAAQWLATGKVGVCAAVSPRAVTLMEGVVRTMFMTKVKTIAATLALLAALGVGLGLWSQRPAAADTRDRKDEGRPAARAAALDPERPVGEWERSLGPVQIKLRVAGDRLFGTYTVAEKGQQESISLSGDYSVTRDGILYGIITDLDFDVKPGTLPGAKEALDAQAAVGQFIDQPFSIRYRVDEGVLILRDFKVGGLSIKGQKAEKNELLILQGRYKKKQHGGRDRSAP